MPRRDYAGGAISTTITADLTASSTSITIASATGWPAGTNGKFFIVINRGGANEEKCLILSRTGTTLTLESTSDRGVDGTTAATHNTGETIEHCFTATDADEANQHINDTASDSHTQYLNNARHDTTARHTLGSVVPTGVPGTISPDDTASEGVANSAARSDHRHAITAAVAGVSAVGDTAGEGAATSFARSDHKHGREAFASPVSVGTTISAGVATTVVRSDHVHDLAADVVTTAKIADSAVTATKVAAGAYHNKRVFRLKPTAQRTLSSGAYVDYPVGEVLSGSFTKRVAATRLIVTISASGYANPGSPVNIDYAVNINAVDEFVAPFFYNTADEHHTGCGAIEITGLAAQAWVFTMRARRGGTDNALCDAQDLMTITIEEVA